MKQVDEADFTPNPLEKPGYRLEIHDDFSGSSLNEEIWLPIYLPQWSSRENSKPDYHLEDSSLILSIDKDHRPWCPEFNGDVKVSSIQTGVYSGKLGSDKGQHRFNKECRVREEQETIQKFTPHYGYFEIRAASPETKSTVVSLWMIGFEDEPHKSSEICVFEIFGKTIAKDHAIIGYGLHPFGDPTITNEFYQERFDLDVTKFQIYAVDWTPNYVDFYVNNKFIRRIDQSPNYPMQFMLGIYELPENEVGVVDDTYPKEFVIDYFRAYRKVE